MSLEISQSTFSFLDSKSWKIDSYPGAVLIFSGGRNYGLCVGGELQSTGSMRLTDSTFKSLYYSASTSRLLIDFASESEMHGKMRDWYLTGSGEINFVARPQ
ncbi:hypothetical protein [Vibrio chagasii]|uniref:Uncharacterized protein n=1 Tax=Vibrio chagasii TaxID=170679 RepID=A0A7Y3YR13_9VIBR|nr:hypothetical protein [Vibrio chagasii]NOH34851.1 hypothetical protein [Vibrio chagasii]